MSEHIGLCPHSGGLKKYLNKIHQFPMLSEDEEYTLAKKWTEHKDRAAVQKLVNSHLRLVAKIAAGYKGYGLPMADLIAEGNIGMLQALKRFDPEMGNRFSTYAMWWIKASMQEYILKTWSLVRIGTTAAQKKLFFNLKRLKDQIKKSEGGELERDEVSEVAKTLNVSESDVQEMEKRLSGSDYSLNVKVQSGDSLEWQDWVNSNDDLEEDLENRDELNKRSSLLSEGFARLDLREQEIIKGRRLTEPPLTLDFFSKKLEVSKERIRQIEVKAFKKLQKNIKELALEQGMIA